MSLDNTSHPGRPGPDELVPSRYALRVGELDVLVVSDGVLSLPGAMLGHNADPAVRAAWLDDMSCRRTCSSKAALNFATDRTALALISPLLTFCADRAIR